MLSTLSPLSSSSNSCFGLLWAALTHLCTENRAATLCLYATVILQLHALTVNAAAARPSVLAGSGSSSASLATAPTGTGAGGGSVSVSVNDLNALFRFLALLLSIDDSLADWRVQLILVGYKPESLPESTTDAPNDSPAAAAAPAPALELSSQGPLEKLFARPLYGLLDLIEEERSRDVFKAYLCVKFIVNSNVQYPRLQAQLEPIEERWRWLVQWLNEQLNRAALVAEAPAGLPAASSSSSATGSSNSAAPLALTYKPDASGFTQTQTSGATPSWSTSSSNVGTVQPMPRSNSASRPMSSRNTDETSDSSRTSSGPHGGHLMQRTLSAQHTLNEALALVRRPDTTTSSTVPTFAQPSVPVSPTPSSTIEQQIDTPPTKPPSDTSPQPMDTDY